MTFTLMCDLHQGKASLNIVVQAGNSGLCGGSVPISDEIILLTSRLHQIISFDEVRPNLSS